MNQELLILLVSINKTESNIRNELCRSRNTKNCSDIYCSNCLLQSIARGYTADLTNTARELAYEPRAISHLEISI